MGLWARKTWRATGVRSAVKAGRTRIHRRIPSRAGADMRRASSRATTSKRASSASRAAVLRRSASSATRATVSRQTSSRAASSRRSSSAAQAATASWRTRCGQQLRAGFSSVRLRHRGQQHGAAAGGSRAAFEMAFALRPRGHRLQRTVASPAPRAAGTAPRRRRAAASRGLFAPSLCAQLQGACLLRRRRRQLHRRASSRAAARSLQAGVEAACSSASRTEDHARGYCRQGVAALCSLRPATPAVSCRRYCRVAAHRSHARAGASSRPGGQSDHPIWRDRPSRSRRCSSLCRSFSADGRLPVGTSCRLGVFRRTAADAARRRRRSSCWQGARRPHRDLAWRRPSYLTSDLGSSRLLRAGGCGSGMGAGQRRSAGRRRRSFRSPVGVSSTATSTRCVASRSALARLRTELRFHGPPGFILAQTTSGGAICAPSRAGADCVTSAWHGPLSPHADFSGQGSRQLNGDRRQTGILRERLCAYSLSQRHCAIGN